MIITHIVRRFPNRQPCFCLVRAWLVWQGLEEKSYWGENNEQANGLMPKTQGRKFKTKHLLCGTIIDHKMTLEKGLRSSWWTPGSFRLLARWNTVHCYYRKFHPSTIVPTYGAGGLKVYWVLWVVSASRDERQKSEDWILGRCEDGRVKRIRK